MKLKPEWKGGLPLTRGRNDPFNFILPQNLKGTSTEHFFTCCFSLLYFFQQCFRELFSTAPSAFPVFPAKGIANEGESGIFTASVAQDSAVCELLCRPPLRSLLPRSVGRSWATPVLSAIKRADCGRGWI